MLRVFKGFHRRSIGFRWCFGGVQGDFRGVPSGFPGVAGIFWEFQDVPGVPLGISGSFKRVKDVSNRFKCFQWRLGCVPEDFRRGHGSSGGFRTFQKYSRGSQHVSKG